MEGIKRKKKAWSVEKKLEALETLKTRKTQANLCKE